MATDVKLDQGDGFLVLDACVVKAVTSDFMLDSPVRRKGGGPFRRAHNDSEVNDAGGGPMQNRSIERFNHSDREAVLDMYVFQSLQEVREQTEKWIKEYNEEGPCFML